MGIPGNAMVFLVMYVVSTIMLNASLVFYDAFLIDATDSEDRYDEVSSQGYAWGYIGSCVPFIICLVLVLFGENFGLGQLDAIRISFVITAVWWVVFSVPVLKNVHQTHYKERTEHLFRDALVGLWATAKRIFARQARVHVHARVLLLYRWRAYHYHDVDELRHRSGHQLNPARACTVGHAVRGVPLGYRVWPSGGQIRHEAHVAHRDFRVFLHHVVRGVFPALRHEFWVLAVCVGLFQGGIQALSRSEFGKLIPKEHANEYYGFFDIFGKYATVHWHAARERVYSDYRQSSIGVLSIAVLFIVGFVLMTKVPEK